MGVRSVVCVWRERGGGKEERRVVRELMKGVGGGGVGEGGGLGEGLGKTTIWDGV